MIRRIKALVEVSPGDLVGGLLSGFREASRSDASDESLDVLLKHAVRHGPSGETDPGRIWKKLRRRVSGPFGGLAIEGPAMGGGGQLAPFARSDFKSAEVSVGAEVAAEAILGINLFKLGEEGSSLR